MQWISLELDQELGGLERAALARHLSRCDGCRATSAEIAAFTSVLRDEPLAEIPRPVVVAGRRRASARVVRWAGAGALAATVAVVGGLALLPRSGTPTASSLSFRTANEQRAFARDHVRSELIVFRIPAAPAAPSFAARALR